MSTNIQNSTGITTVCQSTWISLTASTSATSTYISPPTVISASGSHTSPSPEDFLLTTGIKCPDGGRVKWRDGELSVEYTHVDTRRLTLFRNGGVIDFKSGIHEIAPNTIFRLPDGTVFEIDKDGIASREVYLNAREKVIDLDGGNHTLYESLAFGMFGEIHIPAGSLSDSVLTLPNGTVVTIRKDDSIEINDSDAKTLYKSQPTKEFNKFLNASDCLEDFIRYCKTQRITVEDFSELSISLFIVWLITEAAIADNDPVDEVLPLLTHEVRQRKSHTHKCKSCGKFLTKAYKAHDIHFCSPEHMSTYMTRINRDKDNE